MLIFYFYWNDTNTFFQSFSIAPDAPAGTHDDETKSKNWTKQNMQFYCIQFYECFHRSFFVEIKKRAKKKTQTQKQMQMQRNEALMMP